MICLRCGLGRLSYQWIERTKTSQSNAKLIMEAKRNGRNSDKRTNGASANSIVTYQKKKEKKQF